MKNDKLIKFRSFFQEWNNANIALTMLTHIDGNMILVKLSGLIEGQRIDVGFRRCKYFSGSVKYKKINITVEYNNSVFTVTDKSAGFFVKCEDIYIGKELIYILTLT